jgi:signal transduction histidine kinase
MAVTSTQDQIDKTEEAGKQRLDKENSRPHVPLNKNHHVASWEKQAGAKAAQVWDFRNIIHYKDVVLVLFFSILSVAGGVLLILLSYDFVVPILARGVSIPGISTISGIVLKTQGGFLEARIWVAAVGALLIAGPFFLNRFVLGALRREHELRLKAQKRTRQAELLQDILTHDMRNYIQISQLSADLIKEQSKEDERVEPIVHQLLDSIQGSTMLIERAKMLGKIISDSEAVLYPVDLLESLKRSYSLAIGNNPTRAVKCVVKIGSSGSEPIDVLGSAPHEIKVLGDDLVDEVFSNVLANSIKYSEDEKNVSVEIQHKRRGNFYCTSIANRGKGIPEELMPKLFSRYLSGAKGSGLGLSIVHALVVQRYGGKVEVENWTEAGKTRGTVVHIWLKKA